MSNRRPRGDRPALAELTRIVRPPGRPQDIRAFRETEADLAAEYAEQFDATVDRLNH